MKQDQVSSTAFTVMQGILYIAQSSPFSYLVKDEVAEVGKQLLMDSEDGQKRLQQLKSPILPLTVKIKEFLMLPGITLHYILRKSYIEDKALEAIANGAKQIVNLGAGFDTLAWRFCQQHADVNFVEIDHPATSKYKKQALQKDADDLTNMHFLSVDFSQQNLYQALSEFEHFDQTKPTLYICEGVLMYLSKEDINILFDSIHNLTGSHSQLVFTAIEPQHSPKNNIRNLLYFYLKTVNEPICWTQDSTELEAFVKSQNCRLEAYADTAELRNRYIKEEKTPTLHWGEYLVSVRFDDKIKT